MKHRIIIIVLALVALLAMPTAEAKKAKDKKGTPEITLAEKSFDFGAIGEKAGPISHEFRFRNTGTAPLIIVSATASCGCTRPKYPTEPIKPGKDGVIKVTYLPDGRPGEFDKVVKIRTNAPDAGKKFTLKITGTVIPLTPKK